MDGAAPFGVAAGGRVAQAAHEARTARVALEADEHLPDEPVERRALLVAQHGQRVGQHLQAGRRDALGGPSPARGQPDRGGAAVGARPAAQVTGRRPWVAVGLAPAGAGRARVAVRLEEPADAALLPDLGASAAASLDLRVIGPVRALSSPAPADLRRRVRPLRPGLSVAHPSVTAGTLGGFVRFQGRPALLSNNHVLAASNAATIGDPTLQPGPADGGTAADRVGTLAAFQRLTDSDRNLVDAAVATLDDGVATEPQAYPGGALADTVAAGADVDPDEVVEKVGRTTGHTRGRISAVEVDGVSVQYDETVHVFDDQIEIEGLAGAFSAGGDSGSVIWRSSDRAPLGLLFAGSDEGGSAGGGVTFANPLSAVLSALGVDW